MKDTDTPSNFSPKPNKILAFFSNLLPKSNDANIKDTLEDLLEKHDDRITPIDDDERQLISNILHAGEKTVKDIMVPRSEISAVNQDKTISEAMPYFIERPHSRFLVYKENLDTIVGVVHIKDILLTISKNSDTLVKDLMSTTLFVVPSMRMLDLLLQMRIQRKHLCVVVDEFGGVDGMATIEDAIEEIIGDIEDEHDQHTEDLYTVNENGTITIDARYELDDLEKSIGSFLTDEDKQADIDSIGGLVAYTAGRVPANGEIITHSSGLNFRIIRADPRRIKMLQIRNVESISKKQN